MNSYNVNLKGNTVHAEIDAIMNLKKSIKVQEVSMVVFRRCHDGIGMAKPCENCIRGIKYGLRRKNYKLKSNKCYYSDENGNIDFVYIS